MISTCQCSPEAEAGLLQLMNLGRTLSVAGVELEFKELPYCIVSRAKVAWRESMGDAYELTIKSVSSLGLVVDPGLEADPNRGKVERSVLVPWQNIISLSIIRAEEGAKGSTLA